MFAIKSSRRGKLCFKNAQNYQENQCLVGANFLNNQSYIFSFYYQDI